MIYGRLGYETLTMPLLLMVRTTKDDRDRGEGGRQKSCGRHEGVCSCEIGAVPDKRE